MLKGYHDSLQSLCHHYHPLSRLRDAVAGVLSANEEKDWAYFWVKIVVNHVIPLTPNVGRAVVVVIQDLIEPILLLIEDELILWVLRFGF